MAAHALVIFDEGGGRFGPLTDLRAAFELRTGAVTSLERIERVLGEKAAAFFVPPALAPVVEARYPRVPVNRLPDGDAFRFVPGRWIARKEDRAPGATLRLAEAKAFASLLTQGGANPGEPGLITRPWDILARLEETLRDDVLALDVPSFAPAPGVSTMGDHPIKVAANARVHPMVVLNAEKGPIVIDEGAIVGSFCVLAGPCYVGPHAIIQPHTHLRANCSIGPHCLVAGEVSHTVFQGYANKAHSGYLGNALVGEWVNLGADTNASNLKNTYGTIRVQLQNGGETEDSGQVKLGPIIGDFTRTSIGTRLSTGACLSTGTMLALSATAPKYTERFAFLTDQGAQRYQIDKFLEAARKAVARRGRTLTPAEEARLRELIA